MKLDVPHWQCGALQMDRGHPSSVLSSLVGILSTQQAPPPPTDLPLPPPPHPRSHGPTVGQRMPGASAPFLQEGEQLMVAVTCTSSSGAWL